MDPVLISMLGLFAGAVALLPSVWLFDKIEAWMDRRAARNTHPAE